MGAVCAVSWSPDGGRIASGSRDHTVRVWDGQTGAHTKTLEGHSGTVFSVAWSPDGRHIVSGSGAPGNDVRIWNEETGRARKILVGHTRPVWRVAWSPTEHRIASASADHTIRIWDPRTGKSLKTLKGHDDVNSVTWSPDGQWFASASDDRTIVLWDIESGRPKHVAEGHGGYVFGVNFSPDSRMLVSRSLDDSVRLWRVEHLQEIARISERCIDFVPIPAFSPTFPDPPLLASFGEEDGQAERTILIWELDLALLLGEAPPTEARFYRNAKVVLVGDTSVGKTGLGLVLSGNDWKPTESSHGRHVWTIAKGQTKTQKKRAAKGTSSLRIIEDREVLLWDLAGQPGYRLIHRLHLHDVAVAAVLCDARSETDPFVGVDYWARAVDQATESGGFKAAKLLVIARADRGVLSVSNKRISELVKRLGFAACYETSAKTGAGVDEMKKALLNAIPWDNLPYVTTPDIFARIKDFLKAEKEKGRILVARDDLFAAYATTHPEDSDDDAFDACLGLLQASGLLRQLSFGNLVLLQPEMLDSYCASLAMAARKEPDGLGYIAEDRALNADFEMDEEHRLADRAMEKSMLLATVEEAVGRGIAIRQATPQGQMIIFPSELRKDFPEFPGGRTLAVAFTFDGPVSAVYSTLAVSLIHSVPFSREELFKNAAIFRSPRGGEYGFAVEYPDKSNDAHGRLTVFFDDNAEKESRLLFLRYVNRQLEKLALEGTVQRDRIYQCPDDGFTISPESVERRSARGETTVICSDCGAHIPMDDLVEETQKPDSQVDAMEAASEEQRLRQQRVTVYAHRLELEEYHTFLCHNSKDKPAVRKFRGKLADWGIVSWIDEKGIIAGDQFVPELENVIETTPTALIIVGPNWMGQWQKQEYYALLDRAATDGLRLIPVLLPGVPRKPELPVFLRGRQWIDFRSKDGLDDRETMRQLVNAILEK